MERFGQINYELDQSHLNLSDWKAWLWAPFGSSEKKKKNKVKKVSTEKNRQNITADDLRNCKYVLM